jgi:4-hydroxybenzoate polyprenyltransferase
MSESEAASARATPTGLHVPPAVGKWWIYQRERFPILTHGLLIAVFSFSTISFSAMARGHTQPPSVKALFVALASAFIFFLQLRIADEFKDFAEDARYRPYRPVPRGLISLRELGIAGIVGGAVQLALALWLSPALIPFLLLAWGYLALMSKEFFVRDWLKARPITYMWTHMLILPLVDLYGTACDWRVANVAPPVGLIPLLIVSFCNGFVLEIGRKIRAPADEEHGVETYTFLWGRQRAVCAWYGVLLATAAGALVAAAQIQFDPQAGALLLVLLAAAAVVAVRFLSTPASGRAKVIELTSGIWTLGIYLGLGPLPLIVKLWEVRP